MSDGLDEYGIVLYEKPPIIVLKKAPIEPPVKPIQKSPERAPQPPKVVPIITNTETKKRRGRPPGVKKNQETPTVSKKEKFQDAESDHYKELFKRKPKPEMKEFLCVCFTTKEECEKFMDTYKNSFYELDGFRHSVFLPIEDGKGFVEAAKKAGCYAFNVYKKIV